MLTKNLLVLTTIIFSSLVSAQVIRFSHTDFGRDGFGQYYYNCTSAESSLEGYLAELGVQDVRVNCYGGIENWGMFPITLEARFTAPQGQTETEVLFSSRQRGDSSCFFHTKLLNALLAKLAHVKVISKRDRCSSQDSSWSYKLSVKK
jgi:hypothetical protein